MAVVYEHTTSRDRDQIGADVLDATRTMVVHLGYAGEDPIIAVQRRYREGSTHPDPDKFPGLALQRYLQRRTDSPACWYVDLIYDYPDAPGFAGWRLSVDYGEETVRKYRDLDGQLVGAHAYTPVDESSPAPWSATTLTGTTKLLQADDDLRRREGMDIYRNATTIVLSRTLRMMTATRIAQVEDYKHHYNAERFVAWDPGHLLFRQAIIREEPGPPAGEGSLRSLLPLVWPTELRFSVRKPNQDEPEGWPKLRLVDTYRDGQGNEAVVQHQPPEGPSEPVSTTYRRYPSANFHDVIAILEGGSVGARAGGRRP